MSEKLVVNNEGYILVKETDINLLCEVSGHKISQLDGFDFYYHLKTRPHTFSFQKGNERYFFHIVRDTVVYIGPSPEESFKKKILIWVNKNVINIGKAYAASRMGRRFTF